MSYAPRPPTDFDLLVMAVVFFMAAAFCAGVLVGADRWLLPECAA